MATINAIAHLTVTTQSSSSSTVLMKEPRSYQYGKIITVGQEENPDENPDIL